MLRREQSSGSRLFFFALHVVSDGHHDHVIKTPIALLPQFVEPFKRVFPLLIFGDVDRDAREIS